MSRWAYLLVNLRRPRAASLATPTRTNGNGRARTATRQPATESIVVCLCSRFIPDCGEGEQRTSGGRSVARGSQRAKRQCRMEARPAAHFAAALSRVTAFVAGSIELFRWPGLAMPVHVETGIRKGSSQPLSKSRSQHGALGA